MASFRKKGKVWYFRFVDSEGVMSERKGCPDLQATKQLAGASEAEAAKIRAGLIDPKAEARRRQSIRPLAEHIDDFRAHLIAKGSTPKHADLFAARTRRVAALAAGASLAAVDPPNTAKAADREQTARTLAERLGGARLADLSPARVQSALATLNDAGRSLATCNHHRSAVRGFSRWAWRDGRTTDDALAGVTGFNAKEDRRHDRRTLGLDDLRRLIDTAHNGPTYRRMSGSDRAMCYRLAAASGLRYSEIASITPESFALGGGHPTVVVAAGYTKNGDPATLPIAPELAGDLARWLDGRPAAVPVFDLPEKGSDMIRVDLDAAGIPYRDDAGLYFDFHALRCQCATLADAAGVSPRVVQRLMRHSTLELTGRYTRPRMVDIEGAASALPGLRPTTPGAERAAATGTDGQPIGDPLSHHLPIVGDGTGRIVTDAGGMIGLSPDMSKGRKSPAPPALGGPGRGTSAPVGTSGVRTRTGDLRIMRPPL